MIMSVSSAFVDKDPDKTRVVGAGWPGRSQRAGRWGIGNEDEQHARPEWPFTEEGFGHANDSKSLAAYQTPHTLKQTQEELRVYSWINL